MTHNRFVPPLHIRIWRDIRWYICYFLIIIMPHLIATLCFAALIILLPIMAAFVV